MKSVQSLMKKGGPVYLFTNENVEEYLSQLPNISGARVLTVAGSGDHAFIAYKLGAGHVDTFDANLYQRAIMDLKLIMIKNVSYTKFLMFFNCLNCGRVDDGTIQEIHHLLPEHVTDFLHVCQQYPDIIRRGQFCWPDMPYATYVRSREKYYQIRDVLPDNINFVHTDLQNLSNAFYRRYDIILLSNIVDYAYPFSDVSGEIWVPAREPELFLIVSKYEIYKKSLKPLSEQLLAPNGTIVYDYMWGKYSGTDNPTKIKKFTAPYLRAMNWHTSFKHHFSACTIKNESGCYMAYNKRTNYIDTALVMHKRGR